MASLTSSVRLKNTALASGSLVLVTGVNGFIGSHVANQLLLAGFRVRGTTRDPPKSTWLSTLFDDKYGKGKFEMVQVTDIGQEGAFDQVLKGVQGIIHTAADSSMSYEAGQVIDTAVRGATNILLAASRTPSIRRFVYTSSSTALYMPGFHGTSQRNITQWTWNDGTVAYVQSMIDHHEDLPNPTPGVHDGYMVYAASKTLAEKAVWEWVDTHNPSFNVNVVLPSTTFGRHLNPDETSSTAYVLSALFQSVTSDDYGYGIVQGIQPQYFIDVQDVARLHVTALVSRDTKNERFLGFAEPFNWNTVLDVWRKRFPTRKLPDDIRYKGSGWDESDISIPKRKAESVMKSVGYFGFEVCLERSLMKAVDGLR